MIGDKTMLDHERQEQVEYLKRMWRHSVAFDKDNHSQTASQRYIMGSFENNYWHLRLKVLSPQQVLDNLLHCALEGKLYRGSKELRKPRQTVLKDLQREVWNKFNQYCDYMEAQEKKEEEYNV